MRWINFLHLYQPMNADAFVIKEATEKSYYRIVRALEENNIKFTLNINGCLLVRLDELGFNDLIARVGVLIEQGKVELTGNAMYHPLLPLVEKEEVKKQIQESIKIHNKYFPGYKPKGFFLAEMAYSPEVAKIIKNFGFEWIILDEIACNGKLKSCDTKKIYSDKNSGLKIIFRSRKNSDGFPPDSLKKEIEKNKVIITATDGELYGLRHIDHTAEFEKMLKNKNLETQLISDYISMQEGKILITPVLCSWESIEKELKDRQPFALWNGRKNKIQKELWKLADFAWKMVEENKNDKKYSAARWHLVRGLASCTFWWASGRKLGSFGQTAWNPDEIEKGINELIRAIRSLDSGKLNKDKIKAEKMCAKLREMIWVKHWENF